MWRGTGEREPGSNGGGEVYGRQEKRGREMGYLWGQESGESGNKFCNIAQYFAIEKSTQRREPLREWARTGRTKYGKQEIETPPSPVVFNSRRGEGPVFPKLD